MHGVQQRQRTIPVSVYKHELAKAQLGENVANHMAYIFTIVLYDKMGLTFKQVENYYKRVVDRRMKWQDDDNEEVTSESLIAYCEKRKIHVVKFVKDIPMSQKLYMADIRKARAAVGADTNIEAAMVATIALSVPTLKETYKFSNARIYEFLDWVRYYIDSYCKKQPGCKEHYCSDEIIRQSIIEDENWDIKEGCQARRDGGDEE